MPVRDDIESHYRMLDLQPGATLDEIKASWRDLVKIWHPDRFANDPRLQQKCQEKLKQINESYDLLQKVVNTGNYVYRPPAAHVAYERCRFCGKAIAKDETLCEVCKALFMDEEPPAPVVAKPKSRFWAAKATLVMAGLWFCASAFDQHGQMTGGQILMLAALFVLGLKLFW